MQVNSSNGSLQIKPMDTHRQCLLFVANYLWGICVVPV